MFVRRLNNCRSPTIGEKYESPLPLRSGLSSSFALSCALLVMAPNSAQVVSFSAFTVRSGSALPSVHQNFQPMSQGTYSASNFIRSRTIRAASITSLPTPSPGIHAILYLAIGSRFYRRAPRPQASPVVFGGDHGLPAFAQGSGAAGADKKRIGDREAKVETKIQDSFGRTFVRFVIFCFEKCAPRMKRDGRRPPLQL